MPLKLTVIVPTLNEARAITSCLKSIRREHDGELFVVDGGSKDGTVPLAVEEGARVWEGPRGLVNQCNFGAKRAHGDVLFFVSADSKLPVGWYANICDVMRSPYVVSGGFQLEIEDHSPVFAVLSWGGNFRSRYRRVALGDQGLFARRCAFLDVGGFDDNSLIPYARLCFALRSQGEFCLLFSSISSSSREWRESGFWRTVLRHLSISLRFHWLERRGV